MANINRPKGLSPVQNTDGSPYSQGATLFAVASDASNTYAIGDIVAAAAGGDTNGVPYVTKWSGTVAANNLPVGVIVGIRVADPGTSLVGNSLSLEKTYLPLNAGLHYVYVVTDPMTYFTVQGDSTVWASSNLNNNVNLTITANQTTLGNGAPYSSTVATGPATTNSLPLQIVGLSSRPDNALGAYAELVVRWNVHAYIGQATGRTGV
jgi:hypothetical protein